MALTEELIELQADVTVLYFKAHGYHWNVEGPDFGQYHSLFQEIYEDIYSSIDPIAENIRKLGEYAPFKLDTLIKLTSLSDSKVDTNPKAMAKDLLKNNEQVVGKLKSVFDTANEANEQGIANFIAERLSAHGKYRWQLTSYLKTERA
jgi:starvation-inducible DNA-binding protein